MRPILALLALSSTASLVSAHALLTSVKGANGVVTTGFGVINTTLRTGTDEQPFQTDTSVMKDLLTDPCGRTLANGSVDIPTNLAAVQAQGGGQFPSLDSQGIINMTLHQVNADGGGPFSCMVNTDATGTNWTTATMVQQPPGTAGLIRGGPNDAEVACQVPTGTVCTGGDSGNVCLLRLNNGGGGASSPSVANGAGPFGGCLAVQNADSTTARRRALMPPRNHKRRFGTPHARFDQTAIRRAVKDSVKKSAKRTLALTNGDLEDLKTALGTAIDIPIDAVSGQTDGDPNGGNSATAANSGSAQGFDLKKAVQDAIAAALAIMADQAGTETNTTNTPSDTAAANARLIFSDAARKAVEDGTLQTVNAGNAGVATTLDTAFINSAIGALTLINTSELLSGTTEVLAATTVGTAAITSATSAAASATTVATTSAATAAATANNQTGNGKKHHHGNNNNRVAAANNGAGRGGNDKMKKMKRR
ncbi:putative gegh 16 protein [Pseudohyphozyma bogoriensis]|nr:putative gegh 16 protein [Pseudohyphozyma bogoriensis]